jgi:predicted amidohydrolase
VLLLGPGCRRSRPAAPQEEVTVAAVQYGDVDPDDVESDCGPEDHNCAVEALIRHAAEEGAALVVLPEYALRQPDPEQFPRQIGAFPDPQRAPVAARFAGLARELQIFLVINLVTGMEKDLRNTQLAFDRQGRIAAWHHKFELFAGEKLRLVPGERLATFDTPFGRVGLLICADLYGSPRKHAHLTRELGARIVAVSSNWTVSNAERWPTAFARDWGVYVVAANAGSEASAGSGVFAPDGRALATSGTDEWGVVLAEVPVLR